MYRRQTHTHLKGGVESGQRGELQAEIAIGEGLRAPRPRRRVELEGGGPDEGLHVGEGGLEVAEFGPHVGGEVLEVAGDLGGREEGVAQGEVVLQLADTVADVGGED